MLERSLAVLEKELGSNHPDVALGLNNLASLKHNQGKYADAEALYTRSLEIVNTAPNADVLEAALRLDNLAGLYGDMGDFAMAEKFSRLALEIREARLGLIHPEVAKNLNNLGTIYEAQGLFSKSEPLYLRALKIWENQLGPNHVDLTLGLSNLAVAYIHQGKPNLAEPLLLRSLVIWKKAVGPNHPETALSMQLLANCYVEQKRYPEARQLYESALDIWQKAGRQNQRDYAVALKKLGDMNFIQGLYSEAESNYSKALTANENTFGKGHFGSISILNGLGITRLVQGSPNDALSFMRRSTSICRARPATEVGCNKKEMGVYLSLLAGNPGHEAAEQIANEALQFAQLINATGTADAVAKMSARFAKGDGDLAKLVRDRQDAEARRTRAEANLTGAFSKTAKERNPALEPRLRDEIAAADKAHRCDRRRTRPPFPRVPRTRPPPARIGERGTHPPQARRSHARLRGGRDTTYLWVITLNGAQFVPLMAKAQHQGPRQGTRPDGIHPAGNAPRVSVDILHEFHQWLIAPALPLLDGITHLLIVPDVALQSLPFGMLVASPPPAMPPMPTTGR